MEKARKETFYIAILNGGVMDPITRTDAKAIGIKNGKIAAIVAPGKKLKAERKIDATGLVVAPGFINMHSHGSGTGRGSAFIAAEASPRI